MTYPNVTEQDGPVVVTRDGVPVSPILEHQGSAFAWLLRHQGQSVSYALTHGGYAVVPVPASVLMELPTLEQGHTDDMKWRNADTKVWLSRMTVEDGMPADNMVTVERLTTDGRWETIAEYAG